MAWKGFISNLPTRTFCFSSSTSLPLQYHIFLVASRQDRSGTTRRRVVHPAGQQPSRYGAMTDISGPEWSTQRDPVGTH